MERGKSIMGSEVKPVYFFHIPKTSGRFFTVNTILILEHELLVRGIDYGPILKGFGHRSFNSLDHEELLGITFIREPIARTISHYLHILNNQLTDNIEEDKAKFISFLYENPEHSIINYQSKYIAYSGDNEIIDIENDHLPKQLEDHHLNTIKDRLSKIDYVFDVKDQGQDLVTKMLDNLYTHYNIVKSKEIEAVTFENTVIINPQSKILYDSLNTSEISEIENLLNHDMDLYNSIEFTKI
jgi:hypothetical protein